MCVPRSIASVRHHLVDDLLVGEYGAGRVGTQQERREQVAPVGALGAPLEVRRHQLPAALVARAADHRDGVADELRAGRRERVAV